MNEEPPLPGPGPIGMGGFSGVGTGGAGGSTGGTAGAAGAGGTAAGNGGSDMGGSGGTTAGSGGSDMGGSGGTSAGGAAGAGGGGTVCQTIGGAGKLKIGNLVPAAGKVDFCVKPAGGAFQGPVFSCVGGTGGLDYKSISKTLAIAPGTYDIKAVSGGDCTSAGIATAMGVAVDDKTVWTILAFGGGATGETGKVGVFKNDPAPTDASINFRFVNGIHKAGGPLDVGLTDGPTLPTNVSTPVFTNVPFGSISAANPAAIFAIDAQGYAQNVAELPAQNVGAAKTGMTMAIFAAMVDITPMNASITAYGIGIQGDATFAPGAILCNDGVDAGMLNSCKTL